MGKDLPASLVDMKRALSTGEVSSVELAEESLRQVAEWEPKINALTEVLGDSALEAAKRWDAARKDVTDTKLGGVPLAIKDMICTTEGHTTAASKILANYKSPYEATVIKKLKQSGGIILAKANMDEFAMGVSTEFSSRGVVKNPKNLERVAGGSSGGSAAAVASGEVPGALGTDTGGSIRQPASFCGVVGLRPTYGRVSRFGVIAYGSSMDQVGPITQTVRDSALMLEVIAGADSQDATCSAIKVPDYTQACGRAVKGIRMGVPKEYFGEEVEAGVSRRCRIAIDRLQDKGVEIVEISLPLTWAAIAVYYLIVKAEAATNLSRYDGLRFGKVQVQAADLLEHYAKVRGQGFGEEVKRAILMGTYALSAGYYDKWYRQASKVRALIKRELDEALKTVDIIAGPTAPEVAFEIGAKIDDPLAMYLSDALTVPAAVSGLPALSVPVGEADRLPVGLQLTAGRWNEEILFQVGCQLEEQK